MVATGWASGRATLSAVNKVSRQHTARRWGVRTSRVHRITVHRITVDRFTVDRFTVDRIVVGRIVVGAALFGLCATTVGACSDGDAGSAERFCGKIVENKTQLTAPALTSSDDIEPLLDLYRDIGDLAPLSIEQEWTTLVAAYETASTVVIGDPESEQTALAAIYASEESAAAIDGWLVANCAVDIGPIVTLVPQEP